MSMYLPAKVQNYNFNGGQSCNTGYFCPPQQPPAPPAMPPILICPPPAPQAPQQPAYMMPQPNQSSYNHYAPQSWNNYSPTNIDNRSLVNNQNYTFNNYPAKPVPYPRPYPVPVPVRPPVYHQPAPRPRLTDCFDCGNHRPGNVPVDYSQQSGYPDILGSLFNSSSFASDDSNYYDYQTLG